MEIKKYPYIDALRGLAILAVLMAHSAQAVAPTNAALNLVMQTGALGVQLFYIVSAITLCMSWDARAGNERWPKLSFYLRRFFRIAPMFYFAIILYLFIHGFDKRHWAPNGINGWFVLLTAFFMNGFNPETINSVVPGGWSIAVEMTFYLLFPCIVYGLRSYGALVKIFLASLIFLKIDYWLCPRIFHYPPSQSYLVDNFVFLNFWGQLPVFLIGVFAYFYIKVGYNNLTFYFAGGCLLVAMCFGLYFSSLINLLIPDHVMVGIIFAIFTIFLAVNPSKIIVNMVSISLGKVSYGIYLLHFAVLDLFSKLGISESLYASNLGSLAHFILLVIFSAVIAYLTLLLIEKPGIKLGFGCVKKINVGTNNLAAPKSFKVFMTD